MPRNIYEHDEKIFFTKLSNMNDLIEYIHNNDNIYTKNILESFILSKDIIKHISPSIILNICEPGTFEEYIEKYPPMVLYWLYEKTPMDDDTMQYILDSFEELVRDYIIDMYASIVVNINNTLKSMGSSEYAFPESAIFLSLKLFFQFSEIDLVKILNLDNENLKNELLHMFPLYFEDVLRQMGMVEVGNSPQFYTSIMRIIQSNFNYNYDF